MPPCNEILREFYTHLQSTMVDQLIYLTVAREITFTKDEILRAISILDVPEEDPHLHIGV